MTRAEFEAVMRIRRSFGDVDVHCQLMPDDYAELEEECRPFMNAAGQLWLPSCNGITMVERAELDPLPGESDGP